MIDEDNKYVKLYRSIGCTDNEIERVKQYNLYNIEAQKALKNINEMWINEQELSKYLTDKQIEDCKKKIVDIDMKILSITNDLYNPMTSGMAIEAILKRLANLPIDKREQYYKQMDVYMADYERRFPNLFANKEKVIEEIDKIIEEKKNKTK